MKTNKTKKDVVHDENTPQEKTCIVCKRIIMEENNNTGICPKCRKTSGSIGLAALLSGGAVFVRKYGGKLIGLITKHL